MPFQNFYIGDEPRKPAQKPPVADDSHETKGWEPAYKPPFAYPKKEKPSKKEKGKTMCAKDWLSFLQQLGGLVRIVNFTLLWRWLLVVSSIFVMYGFVTAWNRAVETFAQSSAGSLGDAVGSTMGYGMGIQALQYVGQTFGFHTSESYGFHSPPPPPPPSNTERLMELPMRAYTLWQGRGRI